MQCSVYSSLFVALIAFAFMVLITPLLGYLVCDHLRRKLSKRYKKNRNDLKALVGDYRFLLKISRKVNKRKFSLFYNKKYWNKVIIPQREKIEDKALALFKKQFDAVETYPGLNALLFSADLHFGEVVPKIKEFLDIHKGLKIDKIVGEQYKSYPEEKRMYLAKNMKKS